MTNYLSFFLFFGQSNELGAVSLSTMSDSDFQRLTGLDKATTLAANPVNFSVPGSFWWKTKMPHGTAVTVSSPTSYGTNDITKVGAFPGTYTDQWVWIKTAATNAGQVRRIAINTADVLTLSASPAWTGTPTNPSSIEIWTDSFTISSVGTTTATVNGVVQTVTTLTVTGTPLTASAHVGRWVTIIYAASFLAITQVARIVSNTTSQLVLDRQITAPAAGDGIRIATGGGVNDIATFISQGASSGKFDTLNINYELMTSYTTGYEYPSIYSSPRGVPTSHYAERGHGSGMETAWGLQQALGQPVYISQLAIGATPVSMVATIDSAVENFSWFSFSKQNDWNAASTSTFMGTTRYDLLGVLIDIMLVNQQAWVEANIGADYKLDVRGIFCLTGESDAVTTNRADLYAENMRQLRKKIRTRVAELGLCSTNAERIPFIPATIHANPTQAPYSDTVNTAVRALEQDDQFTVVVETTDLATTDNTHYTAASHAEIGRRRVAAWKRAAGLEATATDIDADRLTLLEVRDQVKRRYERAGGSNTRDSVIDQLVNDALRELYNLPGDDCFYLKQVTEVASVPYPGSTLLPNTITRLIWVEDPLALGQSIRVMSLNREDSGRWRVVVDSSRSPLRVHHVITPKDVSEDADRILLPNTYTELLVTMVCLRLSEQAGNPGSSNRWQETVNRLQQTYLQDCTLAGATGMPRFESANVMTNYGTRRAPWRQ